MRLLAEVKEVKVKNQWKDNKKSQRITEIKRMEEAIVYYQNQLRILKSKGFMLDVERSVVTAIDLMRTPPTVSASELKTIWSNCCRQFQEAVSKATFEAAPPKYANI